MGRIIDRLVSLFAPLFGSRDQAPPGVEAASPPTPTPARAAAPRTLECTLRREPGGITSTPGNWYIGQAWECFTLEDVERDDPNPDTPANEAKVPGRTAIPRGRYEIELVWSPKFGRIMPRLLNVPGFEGILVHWGNTDRDTDGCILVGRERSAEFIGNSRSAFDSLYAKLSAAKARGDRLFLTVT